MYQSEGVVEGTPAEAAASGQNVRISYQEYRRIADLLIMQTHQIEETGVTQEPGTTENGQQSEPTAIRKSQLVNWYLEEIAVDTLHSEAELVECKLMVELVLDRLIKKANSSF